MNWYNANEKLPTFADVLNIKFLEYDQGVIQ